ncbi:hypothetical protein ABIB51_004255 [Arthrobacter sp. UYCu712]
MANSMSAAGGIGSFALGGVAEEKGVPGYIWVVTPLARS